MNSPNVIVYDDYPLGSEEPVLAKSEYLKPQVKLSRTHSKKKKERIVDPHKSNEWTFIQVYFSFLLREYFEIRKLTDFFVRLLLNAIIA